MRWQTWTQAQASRGAWEASRTDEDWGEHFTPAQQAARDWAIPTELIDE